MPTVDQDIQDTLLRRVQPVLGAISDQGLVPSDGSYDVIFHVVGGIPRGIDLHTPIARNRKGLFKKENENE